MVVTEVPVVVSVREVPELVPLDVLVLEVEVPLSVVLEVEVVLVVVELVVVEVVDVVDVVVTGSVTGGAERGSVSNVSK